VAISIYSALRATGITLPRCIVLSLRQLVHCKKILLKMGTIKDTGTGIKKIESENELLWHKSILYAASSLYNFGVDTSRTFSVS
jgi:hypothetical protein